MALLDNWVSADRGQARRALGRVVTSRHTTTWLIEVTNADAAANWYSAPHRPDISASLGCSGDLCCRIYRSVTTISSHPISQPESPLCRVVAGFSRQFQPRSDGLSATSRIPPSPACSWFGLTDGSDVAGTDQAIATIGEFRRRPPTEPRNGACTAKIPPSAATS